MEIKHVRPPLLVFGLVILGATLALMIKQTFTREVPSVVTPQVITTQQLTLTSPAFSPDTAIPALYSCTGANINPTLEIENTPNNTQEFVLILHDPDAQSKDWVHWLAWNIPADTTRIAENSLPNGSMAGTTDSGKKGYDGPCPEEGSGSHRYIFELYALNDKLNLSADTTRDELIAAINGKIIARTQLTGTFESKKTNP